MDEHSLIQPQFKEPSSSPMHCHLQQNIQTPLIVFKAGDTKPDLDQNVTFVYFLTRTNVGIYLYPKNANPNICMNMFVSKI